MKDQICPSCGCPEHTTGSITCARFGISTPQLPTEVIVGGGEGSCDDDALGEESAVLAEFRRCSEVASGCKHDGSRFFACGQCGIMMPGQKNTAEESEILKNTIAYLHTSLNYCEEFRTNFTIVTMKKFEIGTLLKALKK